MYILYYHQQDYDYCDHENIASSPDRGKLEERREKLLVPSRQFRQELEVYKKQQEAYQNKCKKAVRKFLEKNIECVKEIRPQLFDGTNYVPDFHHRFGKPYTPEHKRQEQEKALDVIVNTHWSYFIKGCDPHGRLHDFINDGLLKEPLLQLPHEKYETPRLEGKFYQEDSLMIEEIEEI